MKLYEIAEEYKSLQNQLEDSGGEISEAEEAALDALTASLSDKLESLAKLIKNIEAESAQHIAAKKSFDEEAKRYKAKSDACLTRIEGLKWYMSRAMEAAGEDKIKTDSFSFALRDTYKVEEVPGEEVPAEFLREKISYAPDKTGLLKYYKSLSEEDRREDFGGLRIVKSRKVQVR